MRVLGESRLSWLSYELVNSGNALAPHRTVVENNELITPRRGWNVKQRDWACLPPVQADSAVSRQAGRYPIQTGIGNRLVFPARSLDVTRERSPAQLASRSHVEVCPTCVRARERDSGPGDNGSGSYHSVARAADASGRASSIDQP
jgi:hypothetical protein